MISIDLTYDQIRLFLLLLSRCSGIFIFTPFLGNFNVPAAIRILLSMALGYFLYLSSAPLSPGIPFSMGNILVGVLGELVIGLVIGYAAHSLFAGLQFAGHLIGFQIGLSFVNTVDPTTSSRSTTLSIYYNFLGLMLFLGFNGHHWFIETLARSVTVIPPYSLHLDGAMVSKMGLLMGKLFVIGFQVAAPVVAVLLLTDIALGIAGRTAPQVHILVIGFPLKVLVGIFCLGSGLYFLPTLFRGYSMQLYQDLNLLMKMMGR
jgi:flagellar biosynthetic protein FliR